MSCVLTGKSVTLMLSSIIIFGLILLLGLVLPVFNHSRDWGYKPAGVVGAILVVVLVAKFMGYF